MLPRRARAARPTPCPPGLVRCFAAGEYAGLLRDLVLAHKEHGAFPLAGPLGATLAVACRPALPARASPVLLVPVPSRGPVVRERGHDPMLRITRAAARVLATGRQVGVARLLEVRAPVRDQAGLSAGERAANLSGSMRVRAGRRAALARAGPVSLLVCDDVLTTGATAREAQRALEEAGLAVRAVVTVAATRRLALPISGLSH